MKKVFGLVSLFVVLFAVGACNSAPSGAVQEFTVEMREYRFAPETITVNANQPVKINILNKGNIEHDFSIMEIPLAGTPKVAITTHDHTMTGPEPQIHASAQVGTKNTIEFTPTKPGTYVVYCVIKGHKEEGMEARLIVK